MHTVFTRFLLLPFLCGFGALQAATPMVAAGYGYTVALKADGTLWAWGANASDQIDGDATAIRTNPVQIGSDYKAVAAGPNHTLALKTDGTLWAWGANSCGQLGDGTVMDRTSPVRIGSGFTSVVVGHNYTVALKADGTLWAWGANDDGQLGDGTTIDRYSPVHIGTGYNAVAAGFDKMVALKDDGSVWEWGSIAPTVLATKLQQPDVYKQLAKLEVEKQAMQRALQNERSLRQKSEANANLKDATFSIVKHAAVVSPSF